MDTTRCVSYGCTRNPTQVGTLSYAESITNVTSHYSLNVAYCDKHREAVQRTADASSVKLILTLKEIQSGHQD